ncbi:MAG: hypothetical protein RJA34_3266 [Pseudomonadota bacterium]|jgi:hypothetical protein
MIHTMTSNFSRKPLLIAALLGVAAAAPAGAQTLTVTSQQQASAQKVAQAGVPLSDLSPNAPSSYTVKSGDTLWAISGLFLTSPWRWPELWGMNLKDIRNPHRIYPGQVLFLDIQDGMARLRSGQAKNAIGGADSSIETVRVSPRTRVESLGDAAIPTIDTNAIEPFLAEPIVLDEQGLNAAPRIVATAQEGRVLLARGDRAYARGPAAAPMAETANQARLYRVFRNATALKDPVSGEVLGYEAQYVGKASLERPEGTQTTTDADGKSQTAVIPATIDIVAAKEEMRMGDRLLPEPAREFNTYMPHAPLDKVDARVVSVYGSAVANAAQSQVVAINKGQRDGMERGHVMAILKDGARLVDKTDPERAQLKLPDERNGLLIVFRTFERVSYALVLNIKDAVRVGDRLVNPR